MEEFLNKLKKAKIEYGMAVNEYGTIPEFDKYVDSDIVSDRLEAVKLGYALEKLANDKSPIVREAVKRKLS